MKLLRADISNFRSIKELSLWFSPSCRVLVGINESGKSNILRALALLDPDRTPTADDVREFPGGEDLNQAAYVRFVFALNSDEVEEVYGRIAPLFLTDKPGMTVMDVNGKSLALKGLCNQLNEVLYTVNIRNGARHWTWWSPSDTMSLPAHVVKPKASAQKSNILGREGVEVALGTYSLLDGRGREAELADRVEPATPKDVVALVGKHAGAIATDHLPDCVWWSYSEDSLLPGRISTAGFAGDPNTCIPLRSMFELAKVENIAAEIKRAGERSNGMRNLLKRVAEHTTKHFHEVWSEYGRVRFSLSENGQHIEAAIEDEDNTYNMSRRSDGFKRFMSFLLLISARVRAERLSGVLYLHDEPDVSLHPSGARFMRDELIRLSKSNTVVYSTHSPYMIDRKLIERHLIVEKIKEVTKTKDVEASTIQDEEVLLQAIGTSMFESLREHNLIFEGWRDKELFEIATQKWPSGMNQSAKRISALGVCFAKGVKAVTCVTSMLQLAGKECIVVSDGDEVARQHQTSFRDASSYGSWLRYDELLVGGGVITAEDFVSARAWIVALAEARASFPSLPDISQDEIDRPGGRLQIVLDKCTEAGVAREQQWQITGAIKDSLFGKLTRANVEERYFHALEALARRLPE